MGKILRVLTGASAQQFDTGQSGQLEDLTVTSSTYGSTKPKGYGTARVSGNMIWALDIEEIATESEIGGKGGGSQKQTTYTYFGTFAIAFGEGPADDVLRIWADGKLIYDKTGSGDDISKVNVNIRFYEGNETQLPDSLMEVDKGVNNVPAYRGLVYMVFDRLPLADFGNHIPNITAEITFNGTVQKPVTTVDFYEESEGGILDGFQSDAILPDLKRGYMYISTSSSTPEENVLKRINIRTMKEERQSIIDRDRRGNAGISVNLDPIGGAVNFLSLMSVLPDGQIVANTDNGNSQPITFIDPNTMQPSSTFGTKNTSLTNTPTNSIGLKSENCAWIETGLGDIFFLGGSVFNEMIILRANAASGIEYVWDSDTFVGDLGQFTDASSDRMKGCIPGAVKENSGTAFFISGPRYNVRDPGTVSLLMLEVESFAFYDADTISSLGVELTQIIEWSPTDLIPGQTLLADVSFLGYDKIDGNILLEVIPGDEINLAPWWLKVNSETGDVMWRTEMPSAGFNVNQKAGFNHSEIKSGVFGMVRAPGAVSRAIAVRTTDGEIIHDVSDWSRDIDSSSASFWNSDGLYFIGHDDPGNVDEINKFQFFRSTGDGILLSELVRTVCNESGLADSDIDVTDLSGITVPGYFVSKVTTGRKIIEELQKVYFFDAVESDYQIKFLLRDGKSSVATIEQEDIGLIDARNNIFLKHDRVQDPELPLVYTLSYLDQSRDYQENAHAAKRTVVPTPTMSSKNNVKDEVKIILTGNTGKQAAEKRLYSSWIERDQFEYPLPHKYLDLDPTDLVTLNLETGDSFLLRLNELDIGADMTLDAKAVSQTSIQFQSSQTADSGSVPGQEFLSVEITKLIILCSPLLQDGDESGRTVSKLYYFMGGFGQPGWPAGILYRSSDNIDFTQAGAITSEMTWGAAANALPAPTSPHATDTENSLTVFLNTNLDVGLSSITELQMLNGGNAAALIHQNGIDVEIIQFQDVTLNSDGSYTLTNLLRGRRGTEGFVYNHSAGDIFVLLEPATGSRIDLTLGSIGSDRYYKGVTAGSLIEDADTITKASPGNDLKPYSPVQLAKTSGSWGGDVVLEWVRRTRVGGQMVDGNDVVALNEDSEEYEIDILAGSGRIARTVTSLSSPSYTYSAANQSTDFPSGYVDETADLMGNPSFEAHTTTASFEGNEVAGWTVTESPGAVQVRTGTDGNISGAQDGDNWLSMEEANVSSCTMYTLVDLTGYASAIAQGSVSARLQHI
jgi:hypothetical protein